MLQLHNVSLGGRHRFDHQFADGQIAVVLGSNRSGKTNLCRLIAGLDSAASGQVMLDGKSLDGLSPARRSVAMVYQAFVNYPNLTVAENIASPLVAAGTPKAVRKAQVAELARSLQLEDLLTRLPAELSGGQQQRLAIARALAKQARVILLDEPLVNLDFKLREALEVELRDLLVARQSTVIYTSSDPRDAFTLGDEVLLLEHGDKLQAGPPMQVYGQPRSLAAMHLLSDPGANQFMQGDQNLAVRPEHLHLQPLSTGAHAFTLHITAIETSGDESFVHGDVTAPVQASNWVMRMRGMTDLRTGGLVQIYARDEDLQRFACG
ncbi:MAG: ABC transporter ATP-binding protein [Pseudomonadota bacterium]